MKCALFLSQSGQQEKECWRQFSVQFFKYYRDEIESYFGYTPGTSDVCRLTVKDRLLFLAVMTALYRTGMFGGNIRQLADSLDAGFDTGVKYSTLLRILYDDLEEYEDVLGFFKDYRKYKI